MSSKILIVETSGALGESIARDLNEAGYHSVTLVKNGMGAVESIRANQPDLVLLDVSASDVDAYDLIAQMRADTVMKKSAIFLMSNQGVPINMRRVPEGSVQEFVLALGPHSAELVRVINRYFGKGGAPLSAESPAKNAPTILWVEDDKLIGTILEKKFISSGFNLIHVKNGPDALKALENTIPDAIVLDLVLPEMDGFEILQKVKMMGGVMAKVPAMILSNLNKPSDIEKAKILGAQKYIVKVSASLDHIIDEVRALVALGKK